MSDEENPTLIFPESYTAECGGDHPMEDAEAFVSRLKAMAGDPSEWLRLVKL